MGGFADGAPGFAPGGTAPTTETERYYNRLGVTIKPGRTGWASCRCFLPGHPDRHASASVNLASGAWRCHACKRTGSAYDAARAHGWNEADARQLAREHGLWVTGRPRFPRRLR
jgi:hypothetical protein